MHRNGPEMAQKLLAAAELLHRNCCTGCMQEEERFCCLSSSEARIPLPTFSVLPEQNPGVAPVPPRRWGHHWGDHIQTCHHPPPQRKGRALGAGSRCLDKNLSHTVPPVLPIFLLLGSRRVVREIRLLETGHRASSAECCGVALTGWQGLLKIDHGKSGT